MQCNQRITQHVRRRFMPRHEQQQHVRDDLVFGKRFAGFLRTKQRGNEIIAGFRAPLLDHAFEIAFQCLGCFVRRGKVCGVHGRSFQRIAEVARRRAEFDAIFDRHIEQRK